MYWRALTKTDENEKSLYFAPVPVAPPGGGHSSASAVMSLGAAGPPGSQAQRDFLVSGSLLDPYYPE